jgi:cell division transport system permease protein
MLIREALRTIRRTPLAMTMAALTIATALGLSAIFLHLTFRAQQALEDVRSNLLVEAYFDPAIPSDVAEQRSAPALARNRLVRSKRFISKEMAKEEYAKNSGEDIEAVLGMNPLPASIRLHLRDMSVPTLNAVERELRAVEGIHEVRSDLGMLRKLEERSSALELVAIAITILLGISSLAFMGATVRLSVETRRQTIHVLKLLGARKSVLYMPFALEGMLAGLIGGLLGAGLFALLNEAVLSRVSTELVFTASPMRMVASLGLIAIVGVLLGFLISLIAALRFVPKVE